MSKEAYLMTVDGVAVVVPLGTAVYTNWMNQLQTKTGNLADRRKTTLRNMMKAAYQQGLLDAQKNVKP